MKILVVCYYEIKENIKGMVEGLEEHGCEIISYPLYRYKYDPNDKREDYLKHFIKFITSEHPDVLLWWYIGLSISELREFTNSVKVPSILFCHNDPLELDEFKGVSSFFDGVITPNKSSVELYESITLFCMMGVDPRTFYPLKEDKNYLCDVSFYCETAEYANMIHNLSKAYDIHFNLYGPDFLKNKYPDCYIGNPSYQELNYIFNKSKVNIVILKENLDYLSETVLQILASGGLLLTTPSIFLTNNKDCLFLDEEHYITQVRYILENYDDLSIIKQHGMQKSQIYTWYKWAEAILQFFDKLGIKCSSSLSLENMLGTHWFTVQNILNQLHTGSVSYKEGFEKIDNIMKLYTNKVNINKLITQYLKMIQK